MRIAQLSESSNLWTQLALRQFNNCQSMPGRVSFFVFKTKNIFLSFKRRRDRKWKERKRNLFQLYWKRNRVIFLFSKNCHFRTWAIKILLSHVLVFLKKDKTTHKHNNLKRKGRHRQKKKSNKRREEKKDVLWSYFLEKK